MDLSFFVFTLPGLRFVVSFLMAVVVLCTHRRAGHAVPVRRHPRSAVRGPAHHAGRAGADLGPGRAAAAAHRRQLLARPVLAADEVRVERAGSRARPTPTSTRSSRPRRSSRRSPSSSPCCSSSTRCAATGASRRSASGSWSSRPSRSAGSTPLSSSASRSQPNAQELETRVHPAQHRRDQDGVRPRRRRGHAVLRDHRRRAGRAAPGRRDRREHPAARPDDRQPVVPPAAAEQAVLRRSRTPWPSTGTTSTARAATP